MSVRAITFDFWCTLFQDAHGHRRQRLRVEALARTAGVSQAAAQEVLDAAYREFFRVHIEEQRTLAPMDAVRMSCDALQVEIGADATRKLSQCFGRAILDYAPEPVADALAAVRAAAARVPVGLVSDSGMSPGSSLRALLQRHGFTEHLAVLTFSDELGVAKPQAPMFETAARALGVAPAELLHIGDLEPTDVKGIQRLGGTAALFGGVNPRYVGQTEAEHTFVTWREFIDVLPRLL